MGAAATEVEGGATIAMAPAVEAGAAPTPAAMEVVYFHLGGSANITPSETAGVRDEPTAAASVARGESATTA